MNSVASWVTSMIQYVVTAFNTFVEGVGSGVSDFFQSIFLTNTAAAGETPVYELSTFAAVSLVMLGISLAIGVF